MSTLTRRSFFTGLGAVLAAPAVVRSGVLMPLRGIVMPWEVTLPVRPIWAIPDTGGYLYSIELSDILRQQIQPLTRFRVAA